MASYVPPNTALQLTDHTGAIGPASPGVLGPTALRKCGAWGATPLGAADGHEKVADLRKQVLNRRQPLIQIRDQVLDALQADGEADDVGAGAGGDKLFLGELAVGGGRRV